MDEYKNKNNVNREIKFRAWDKQKESYIKKYNGVEDAGVYHFGVFNSILSNPAYSQDELIIQQFTGLKDKHGNPIYEGDVVLVFEEDWDEDEGAHSYVVEWGNEYPAFTLKGYEDIEYNSLQHAALVVKCEIIGNIYQHPELIEKPVTQ